MKVCWQSSCNYRPNRKGRRWLTYKKLKVKKGHDGSFVIKRKDFTVRHTQRVKEGMILGFGWAMCKNKKEGEGRRKSLVTLKIPSCIKIEYLTRIWTKFCLKLYILSYKSRAEQSCIPRTSEGCTSAWLQMSCSYRIKYKHYTGALQRSCQLGCVLYQVSRELCYQTAVCMKAKSLCFVRVQTKHQEKPSTLSSKAYGSRWFGSKCYTFHRSSAKVVTHSSKTDN